MKRKSNGFRFFLFFRPIFAVKKLAYIGFFVSFCRKAYFFPKYFVTLPLVLKWLMYNIFKSIKTLTYDEKTL